MYCSKCGIDIPENQTVCPQCGTDYAAENVQAQAPAGEPKSKMTAGLLAILIGAYGVHNFYLGYTKKAIIQVCVSGGCVLLAPCTLLFSLSGTMAMGIWAIVEGIQIFTGKIAVDAKGIPLKD